ncbi:MAG: bifunctional diaminohydroxyphosphoribosylaminopyrimidine deaminase/5-amino-6-(5-phosphoribosylamino)uracil reductase RibD [Flavobacteriales bacterium]|nr:bifunctional diaminohydroxyphosphoribosylaminopyrimidine deaminase/5-amino-6-(5-phosphoribosylamino)uracil reductase RibD [Flavobacteriales bacterium]
MRRCFQLAEQGRGIVSPNPLVGCVLTVGERIIGEGYHHEYGSHHAEVNAVNSVQDPSLLSQATAYVNLEPCAHHGKTPPCADMLIKHQVKRVVISNRDPFDEVDGKGIERIKAAGIKVAVGVLEDDGIWLNRDFFTYHTKQRPFIQLKWAQTSDGFFDKSRQTNELGSTWITAPSTRKLVHTMRADADAILVGNKTVLIDNPELTVRDVAGKNPLRVVIDMNNAIAKGHRILNDEAPTLIINGFKSITQGSNEWLQVSSNQVFEDLMNALYERKVQRLMVEGGAFTIQRFLMNELWDEAMVLEGNKTFGAGMKAPSIPQQASHVYMYRQDRIYQYRRS